MAPCLLATSTSVIDGSRGHGYVLALAVTCAAVCVSLAHVYLRLQLVSREHAAMKVPCRH